MNRSALRTVREKLDAHRRAEHRLFFAVMICAMGTTQPGSAADQQPAADAGDTLDIHFAEPWTALGAGLERAVFDTGQAMIEVLRIDPRRWETVALAVSDVGGEPRPARAWAKEFDLSAVINAGMFDVDHRTHTGYFRTGEHLNNPRWAQRGYRQAACFEPREPGLPLFTLLDLDADIPDGYTDRFAIVVQNLRLIRKPGENRWPTDTRPWSEACLGEDNHGRMLWIYCRRPHTMHALIEILLDLPLGLVAAQHLEGGRQAQLWIDLSSVEGTTASEFGLPVPNVLGLRPRESPSSR
jgi:hypothetical protein